MNQQLQMIVLSGKGFYGAVNSLSNSSRTSRRLPTPPEDTPKDTGPERQVCGIIDLDVASQAFLHSVII